MENGKLRGDDCKETSGIYDIPDGIIAHLMMECGGTLTDRHVADISLGSTKSELDVDGRASGGCRRSSGAG
jgi:hypothetical protein